MSKNYRILLLRHFITCIWMAFFLPIILAAFFSFIKNLLVPPATYGVGSPKLVTSLHDAFDSAIGSGRESLVLVDNGRKGGSIEQVLDEIERVATEASSSMKVVREDSDDTLTTTCKSSIRGVTKCYGAVIMHSSPDEGGIWNYTIRSDGSLYGSMLKIKVDKENNGEQIYLLPLQHTIDAAIASVNGSGPNNDPLADVYEYPYTNYTQHEHEIDVRKRYHRTITSWMGVAYIASVVWITYHLTGFVATERESGMSQLVDAMMPVRKQWHAQAARMVSHHLSFSTVYAPAWIIGSIIIRAGVYTNTSIGIVLVFQFLAGLALASMSLLFASFFKKAQLSGITAILSILLLAILAQVITSPGTAAVAILSALFSPCAYVYFITHMSRFEKLNRPANLVEVGPNSPFQIPGIVLWIFLVIHIFVYPLIGAVIERSLYGTSTKGRTLELKPEGIEKMGGNAVELREFTKIYKPTFFSTLFSSKRNKPQPVIAVNQLTVNAGRGQIVALLGANGSGKSTTLDAIAGMHKLSKGQITIDGTGGLGIAPQKNVLWDDLTVEEHLRIFNRLKAPQAPSSKEEINELIRAVDLWPKRKSYAKTLSGGQKRKLQLGMMLTGGSAVCCVDEVSSGIDPLSRRKLWDILLAERGRRTLILTTHFLDEADLLADHIAILSKGTLRAAGSSVELKDKLGGGYRVHVYKEPGVDHTPDIPGTKKKDAFDMVTYTAPSSSLAATVIKELERVGLNDYRFSGPTIEDVFLELAEEIRDEEAFRTTDRGKALGLSEKSSDSDSQQQGLKLMNGQRIGYVRQAGILFMKRLTILKRNYFPYLIAFLLPIFAAGLTSLFVQGQKTPGCAPDEQVRRSTTSDVTDLIEDDTLLRFLVGPGDKMSLQSSTLLINSLFPDSGNAGSEGSGSSSIIDALSHFVTVDSFENFTDTIEREHSNFTMGMWLGDENSKPTIAWMAAMAIEVPISAQQFLDVLLVNQSIATAWQAFDIPIPNTTGKSMQLIVYMALAFSCYPAFFALYPSMERRRLVRGLEYSNGVRPFPLWIAYLLFDFIIAVVSSAIVTALWAGLSNIWYHLEYMFVVFFLYGLASILFAYVISLFAKSQLATYAWAAAWQALMFLVYIIAYMCVLTYGQVTRIDQNLHLTHFVVSVFAPIGSIMRALFLGTNLFASACDGSKLSENPGDILRFGGPILYLIIQCLFLFALLIWRDSGSAGSSFRGLFTSHKKPESDGEVVDEELTNELARVNSSGVDEYGLRVLNLTKSFRKNTAVENVTFGIKRGEVFALLGPNGAGKSTTISLIRGDLKPSRNGGDILVEDVSVVKKLAEARPNLGVCPQFDAIDQMTVREHLEFYAKVRGIPDVEHNVAAIIQAVGLEAFATRMAHALSGGNKRKLSLGIALMGNPTVVLLDEPSSGLDAASKRIMWKTLASTVPGRSILLTTHSMEEADALAGRAGIMARRMLALGTPDDLRHRFGDAIHIHLVARTAPRTTPEEMERIIHWVREKFPSANVEEKTYHGQMRFSVRASQVVAMSQGRVEQDVIQTGEDVSQSAIGHLVVMLEEQKDNLGVEHYSVSPTTLDQVFLAIVGKHNVQEENSEETKKRLWRRLLKFKS